MTRGTQPNSLPGTDTKYVFNLGLATVLRIASILDQVNQYNLDRNAEMRVKTLEILYLELLPKMNEATSAEAAQLRDDMITDYNKWFKDAKKTRISSELQQSSTKFEIFLRNVLEKSGLTAPVTEMDEFGMTN